MKINAQEWNWKKKINQENDSKQIKQKLKE